MVRDNFCLRKTTTRLLFEASDDASLEIGETGPERLGNETNSERGQNALGKQRRHGTDRSRTPEKKAEQSGAEEEKRRSTKNRRRGGGRWMRRTNRKEGERGREGEGGEVTIEVEDKLLEGSGTVELQGEWRQMAAAVDRAGMGSN